MNEPLNSQIITTVIKDSKNIIKTMESVIESVNKKQRKLHKKGHHHHHHHHRHNHSHHTHHHHHHRNHNHEKKNNKSNEDNVDGDNSEQTEILIISDAITHNLSIISPNTSSVVDDSKGSTTKTQNKKNEEISSSKENNYSQNVIKNNTKRKRQSNERKNSSPTKTAKSPSKNGSIKNHFIPLKSESPAAAANDTDPLTLSQSQSSQNNSKMNAFEIMMNARNRSIGSNSPGKELQVDEVEVTAVLNDKDGPKKETLNKRKQILKEWADKKGGLKRKLEEEARDEFIDYKMGKRAKRLKNMLTNRSTSTSARNLRNSRKNSIQNNDIVPPKSSRNVRTRKSKQDVNVKAVNDDIIVDDGINSRQKEETENGEIHKKEILSSTPKTVKTKVEEVVIDLITNINGQNSEIQNVTLNSSADFEFVEKLSSPIKKRDSLLGYFPKLESNTISNSVTETTATIENLVTTKSNDEIKSILNSSDDFEKKNKIKKIKGKRKSSIKTLRKQTDSISKEIDLTSTTTALKEQTENSKKPGRKRRTLNGKKKDLDPDQQRSITPVNDIEATTTEVANSGDVATPTTQSGRPRRSCVGKTRYDYDLFLISPTKLETMTTKITRKSRKRERYNSLKSDTDDEDLLLSKLATKVTKKPEQIPDHSDTIISVDDDDSVNGSISEKHTKKLAPIFMKSVPKPVIDPGILKAKQEFLMSGVPEKMRLEIEKQKQYEQNYEMHCEQFPLTVHIYQNGDGDEDERSCEVDWKQYGITLRSDNDYYSPVKICRSNEKYLKFMENKKTFLPPLQKLQKIDNKQQFIKYLKNSYDKFPTYKCYNQLREKYRYFSAIDSNLVTHQITDSLVVTKIYRKQKSKNCNDDDDKPPLAAPNGELLFTEKYKPMLTEQVLVNINPVNRLKEFLSLWQSNRIKNNLSNNNNNADGDDDFNFNVNDASSNWSSNSNNQNNNHNTVVLIGPCSSGKTNAVFAIANELNFNVLEINAGMKRTGKKILQELQEATQSHQVRGSSKEGSNNLFKQTLNGKKKKSQYNSSNNNHENNNSSSSLENSFNEKLSLILIEDADIIFEQDNGFIDAINQLSSISKRPVVITINDRNNCQHLLKLINQNSIEFPSPNVLNISKFLSIISLIENCPIELDDIISLYLYNQKNVRKTLLEMQFFIQSGGDRCRPHYNNSIQQSSSSSSPKSLIFKSSPRKFSIEEISATEDNEKAAPSATATTTVNIDKNTQQNIYIHKTLFDFYTTSQNIDLKIPLPINYNLLWFNLNDIFQVSRNLRKLNNGGNNHDATNVNNKKRKNISSSFPCRKILQNNIEKSDDIDCSNDKNILNSLSEFYENVSVAALISLSSSLEELHCDGEIPNISKDISHSLTELAIDVNLNAKMTAYNLFESQTERLCLTSYISSNTMPKSNRSLQLDYESCLRSICRSEKSRLQKERRTSRFYHYLRNVCTINLDSFSNNLFEKSCEIFTTNSQDHEYNENIEKNGTCVVTGE